MSPRRSSRCLALALIGSLMLPGGAAAQHGAQVESPDRRNEVTVGIRDGRLYYGVQRDDRPVLRSRLTLTLAAGGGQAIRIRPAR